VKIYGKGGGLYQEQSQPLGYNPAFLAMPR
jgi:hypothetical protein